MLLALHWVMKLLFIAAPLWVGMAMVMSALRRRPVRANDNMITFTIGAMIGVILTVLYAESTRGRASLWQFVLSVYFATAMLFVLRGLDRVLRWMLRAAARRMGLSGSRSVILPLMLVRGVLLIGIGLPLVMAGVMVYRPKVSPRVNALANVQLDVSGVRFDSIDNIPLTGWWIPATEPTNRRDWTRPEDFGARTVILCHGIGAGRASQLGLARRLVREGYNALLFDFRGYGSSGGQVSGLGSLERRDVLGAVKWVRANHPRGSQKIVGVGVGTGAAALLAAATDPSTEGQAIQAVAVVGAYDDLPSLTRDLASEMFLPPMDWLTSTFTLPIASLFTGTDLAHFKPARLVQELWPRPILVIHGTHDPVVPFEHGRRLFEAASFPKQPLWLPLKDSDDALNDAETADVVREFFDAARPTPAI
jgi:alpha-beta hydrolase superfamily lysophospholipase